MPTTTTAPSPMYLITSADQYMGHAITSHLARDPSLRSQMRILCQQKMTCLNFSNKGIDVRQVDYDHPNDLSLAMRGIKCMILAVGNEPDRVRYCEHLIDVANRSGVENIICISHVGAVSSTHEALRHFAFIEEKVISSEHCQWTILRPDFIYQHFLLWTSMIERSRVLSLPVPAGAEICPIDISDVCKVVEELVVRSNNNDQHAGQVYTLTGPQTLRIKDLIQWMRSATGFKKLEFVFTRPMDTAYYMQELRNDIWFDARIKREHSLIYQDTLDGYAYRSRILGAPSATQIQTIIDYFDWVHKTSSSVLVPHASSITSLPVRSVRKFLQENANSFKPRV
ncbi:hypothetical protein BCR43DRAFT_521127 [Syncephalastrum racemosum]|uniref:NAD(P)-binding domain-containing protein n=1 Tax=Syncephalastrum racemosum TaxID=13706 RepID=A0A1X2HKW3_SYNRA|nr:hypothetical protein BCR43DRAFT_521127 [Syncephalastrum racemosum]